MRQPRSAPNRTGRLCAIDLGLPGVLPVLNAEGAVHGGHVRARDRRRDREPFGIRAQELLLPGSSQGIPDQPVRASHRRAADRWRSSSTTDRRNGIGITRAHLEEDAGKSVHDLFPGERRRGPQPGGSAVAGDRLGTGTWARPGKPRHTCARVHSLLRYLGICDGNMEEGSFRCDANVSVRRAGDATLGTRTEIKNPQLVPIRRGAPSPRDSGRRSRYWKTAARNRPGDETLRCSGGRDAGHAREGRGERLPLLSGPDLLPVELRSRYVRRRIRAELPELLRPRRWNGSGRNTGSTSRTPGGSLQAATSPITTRRQPAPRDNRGSPPTGSPAIWRRRCTALAWRSRTVRSRPRTSPRSSPASPTDLSAIEAMRRRVFEAIWRREGDPDSVIAGRALRRFPTPRRSKRSPTRSLCPSGAGGAVRAGKEKVFGFFVGRIMKMTRGQANPGQVNRILRRKL